MEAKHTQTTRFLVPLAVPTLERLLCLGQWAPRVSSTFEPQQELIPFATANLDVAVDYSVSGDSWQERIARKSCEITT